MMAAVQEIIAHPRYREFAAAVTKAGRQVSPDAFPWNLMGLTDEEILARPMWFGCGRGLEDCGRPMEEADKRQVIGIVREQEGRVIEHWEWWRRVWLPLWGRPGDPEAAQAQGERARQEMATMALAPRAQGMLF